MKSLIFISIVFSAQVFSGSLFTHKELWDTRDLTVCFADGEEEKRELLAQTEAKISDWSARNKKKVKAWVNEEYSLAKTGIQFIGWSDCSKNPEADIVIFYGKSGLLAKYILGGVRGEAVIGPHRDLNLKGYPSARSLVWLRSDGLNKGTVIHEFGHALGLHHEHMRLEAPKDPKCENEIHAGKDFVFSKAEMHGDYDSDSIMNYCHVKSRVGAKSGLSEGDLDLLRYLYP